MSLCFSVSVPSHVVQRITTKTSYCHLYSFTHLADTPAASGMLFIFGYFVSVFLLCWCVCVCNIFVQRGCLIVLAMVDSVWWHAWRSVLMSISVLLSSSLRLLCGLNLQRSVAVCGWMLRSSRASCLRWMEKRMQRSCQKICHKLWGIFQPQYRISILFVCISYNSGISPVTQLLINSLQGV